MDIRHPSLEALVRPISEKRGGTSSPEILKLAELLPAWSSAFVPLFYVEHAEHLFSGLFRCESIGPENMNSKIVPMISIPPDKPFLNLHVVASALGRSVRTVNRLIVDRQLKAHKFRGRWVVKPECLESFLKKLETNF
jgi:hypothetical protein